MEAIPEKQPSSPEDFVEEAERRTNREAFLILSGGFLFLCAPTLLCYAEYRMFALMVILIVTSSLTMLWMIMIILPSLDLITRLGLRKRKERFLSAEEVEQLRKN
jgi:hypothetical protein